MSLVLAGDGDDGSNSGNDEVTGSPMEVEPGVVIQVDDPRIALPGTSVVIEVPFPASPSSDLNVDAETVGVVTGLAGDGDGDVDDNEVGLSSAEVSVGASEGPEEIMEVEGRASGSDGDGAEVVDDEGAEVVDDEGAEVVDDEGAEVVDDEGAEVADDEGAIHDNETGGTHDAVSDTINPDAIKRSTKEKNSRKRKSSSKLASKHPKRPHVTKLILDNHLRTQHAKRTGQQIKNKCLEYTVKTGAKVFFQSHFTGAKSTHTFKFGEYWQLKEAKEVQTAISAAAVKEAVAEAVKNTLTPILRELGSSRPRSPIASTSSSILSPRKHQQAGEKSEHCSLCNKKNVIKDFIVYDSEWIGCTGDGKPCKKWVHADCLGFPGVENAEVELMPEYYCKDHISYGRRVKKVAHHYESDDPPAPPEFTSPQAPKKKGKRGRK